MSVNVNVAMTISIMTRTVMPLDAYCCYAYVFVEYRFIIVMLSVFIPNVIMPIVMAQSKPRKEIV